MEHISHTPWGIEQTSETLWIGPMRPDGEKVDSVVVSLNYDRELTEAAKFKQLERAYLLAAAPDMRAALEKMRGILRALQPALNVMAREVLDDIIKDQIEPIIAKAAGGAA